MFQKSVSWSNYCWTANFGSWDSALNHLYAPRALPTAVITPFKSESNLTFKFRDEISRHFFRLF